MRNSDISGSLLMEPNPTLLSLINLLLDKELINDTLAKGNFWNPINGKH